MLSEGVERRLTYAEAICEGLTQAMMADPSVVVIGEGVPDPKAIFGTTAGLSEKFGPSRVFDMPLSENGMTGICIGLALSGFRPVMVHQRIDFALLAMDQIVNNAAKWHYMFDGLSSVPLVIRVIIGRGWGQGPQHSQGLHGMFAQVPGLKVVLPSTPQDAKGMLLAAIRDPNPVLFVEHRWLHPVTDLVRTDSYEVALGTAKTLQTGELNTLTIAGFSYGALEALQAARAIKKCGGPKLEVIDMRSARPLDIKAVCDSVQKTGKLLVIDPAPEGGSVSSELIFRVCEKVFMKLQTSPRRICLPDHPIPTAPSLTEGLYPNSYSIAQCALEMMRENGHFYKLHGLTEELKFTARHDVPHEKFVGPF